MATMRQLRESDESARVGGFHREAQRSLEAASKCKPMSKEYHEHMSDHHFHVAYAAKLSGEDEAHKVHSKMSDTHRSLAS